MTQHKNIEICLLRMLIIEKLSPENLAKMIIHGKHPQAVAENLPTKDKIARYKL